jgi:hypothetical protein
MNNRGLRPKTSVLVNISWICGDTRASLYFPSPVKGFMHFTASWKYNPQADWLSTYLE